MFSRFTAGGRLMAIAQRLLNRSYATYHLTKFAWLYAREMIRSLT